MIDDPETLDFRILCADKFGDTIYLGSDGNGLYLVKDGKIEKCITTEESLLKDEDPWVLSFKHVDGLPYEVTPNAYQCMTDKELYVCGTGGVFSLQTDFAQTDTTDYQIVIDSIEMDGHLVYVKPEEVCKIGADVHRIVVDAYVLTYQTGNPYVYYYLDVWNGQPPVREEYPISYVSIDLNNLKKINDRYGHKHGDRLLCAMADLLKKHFSGGQYTVMRTGGDEFLILGRGVKEEELRQLLDQMADEGRSTWIENVPVTFACGVCMQHPGEFDFEEGLRWSDLEMLKAKNKFHGRD